MLGCFESFPKLAKQRSDVFSSLEGFGGDGKFSCSLFRELITCSFIFWIKVCNDLDVRERLISCDLDSL